MVSLSIKTRILLLSVAVGIISCFSGMNAYAQDYNVSGKEYSFSDKSKYEIGSEIKSANIAGNTDFGGFNLSGNIEKQSGSDGYDVYYIKEGYANFKYTLTNVLDTDNVDEWHIKKDSIKTINSIEVDKSVGNGIIVLQTSRNGINWLTEGVWSDLKNEKNPFNPSFYTTNDLQQINGCYFRILIAYEKTKRIEKKILNDGYENSRVLELFI